MFRRNLLLDLQARIISLAGKWKYRCMEGRTETRAASEPMLDDGLIEGQQFWRRKGDEKDFREGSAKGNILSY
jgi:hypothetical protein